MAEIPQPPFTLDPDDAPDGWVKRVYADREELIVAAPEDWPGGRMIAVLLSSGGSGGAGYCMPSSSFTGGGGGGGGGGCAVMLEYDDLSAAALFTVFPGGVNASTADSVGRTHFSIDDPRVDPAEADIILQPGSGGVSGRSGVNPGGAGGAGSVAPSHPHLIDSWSGSNGGNGAAGSSAGGGGSRGANPAFTGTLGNGGMGGARALGCNPGRVGARQPREPGAVLLYFDMSADAQGLTRLSSIGQQILAADPDSGIVRASTVGQQILAASPATPVRVSNSVLEVLIEGEPVPTVRVSTLGQQLLTSAPRPDVRVSNSVLEVLIEGSPLPRGRLSSVGQQILAAIPHPPLRVSNSVLEVLVAGIPDRIEPGKLHGLSSVATVAADMPPPDEAQSDAEVSLLVQAAGVTAEIEWVDSDGRLLALNSLVTLPSPILDWEPTGRLYLAHLQALMEADYLLPEIPQSDTEVTHVGQAAAVATLVDPDGSDLDVSHVGQQAALGVEYDPAGSDLSVTYADVRATWLTDYTATGSDLDVSHIDQRAALSDAIETPDSDITVTRIDQQAALLAAVDPDGSDLAVTALVETAALPAVYPEAYFADSRLHHLAMVTSLPAAWLDDYQTFVRLHHAALQETRTRIYQHPSQVGVSVEVNYLTNCVAFASQLDLGGGPAAEVSQLIQAVAGRAWYSDADAPESTVTVSDLAVEVAQADPSFATNEGAQGPGIPIVSIQLIYDRSQP